MSANYLCKPDMAAQASKWSPLQKADCIFTWPKNCSKMTSLQKASASNMIYTYHYLSAMTGEPAPFFSIKQLVFSALYGTQAPSKRRGNANGDINRIYYRDLTWFNQLTWLNGYDISCGYNGISFRGTCRSYSDSYSTELGIIIGIVGIIIRIFRHNWMG